MREAIDFLLAHVERHGDTQASEKAKQHRFLLAQPEPSADATGDHGEPSAELRATINRVVFGTGATAAEADVGRFNGARSFPPPSRMRQEELDAIGHPADKPELEAE